MNNHYKIISLHGALKGLLLISLGLLLILLIALWEGFFPKEALHENTDFLRQKFIGRLF